MTFTRPSGRGADALAVLLLLVQLAALLHTARCEGETYDEPMYLLAGRAYWDDFDFSFNREHPPLLKLLIGLPSAVDGLAVPPGYQVEPGAGLRYVHETNDRPLRTVFLGRLAPIALTVLLGLMVYLLGRLWAGPRVGLAALVALIGFPAVTGNGALAALDVGSAALVLLALHQFARMRLAPSPWRTLFAGITLGLAQLTKFTAAALVPVFALLLVVDAVRDRSARPLLRGLGLGLVALSTMFAGYGGELRTMASMKDHPRFAGGGSDEVFIDETLARAAAAFGERPLPMPSYLKGLDRVKSGEGAEKFPGYFMGERTAGEGWPEFYLVGLAVKTPVGLLLLLAMAVALAPWLRARPRVVDALVLFAGVTFVTFSLASKQVGLRYVLPALPLAALLVGRLFTFDAGRHPRALAVAAVAGCVALPIGLFVLFTGFAPAGPLRLAATIAAVAVGCALAGLALLAGADTTRRWFGRTAAALLLVGVAEAAARHPEHLMFFNAFAGGPDHGWKITSVGDDWGQGTAALARRQREAGWGTIHYAYYGTGRPESYGLDFRHWGGRPVTGRVAIHAALWTRLRDTYAFLDGLEPVERVDSVLVFDVPAGHGKPAR